MLLGRTSDTDDATGILAAPSSRDAHVPQAGERMLIADEVMAPQTTQALPGEDQIRSAVAEVAARTEQVPPAVSALHIDGQRAHVRVRNGETITVSPRPVRIDEATIGAIGAWHLDDEGAQVCTVELDVRCASGTYLRALARDVGELLGVGGLAMALRRSEVGEWNVSQAGVVRPDAARPGDVRPMLDLLPAAQRCAIDPVAAFELAHGRRAIGVVSPEADPALPLAAVFNDELVAMVDVDLESPLASVPPEGSVVLKPRTVFVRPEELTAEVPRMKTSMTPNACVLVIGMFDGVHAGHRALLATAVSVGRRACRAPARTCVDLSSAPATGTGRRGAGHVGEPRRAHRPA